MRQVSVLAVLVSSVSLAACGGGGGSALTSAMSSASSLSVCGVDCPRPTPTPKPTPTTGGGTGGTGGTTGTGGTNVGNTTNLSVGDTTLIIEKSKLTSAIDKPGISKLVVTTTPSKAKISIDTNTANNALWPIPKAMKLYKYGTNFNSTAVATRNMNGTYKEYRALSYNKDGTSADEVLQVWNWTNSYATHYRDVTAGGEAGHEAWSFGGTKTAAAAMPTSGIVQYNNPLGRFSATAKTANFVDDLANGQTVSFNNLWRVTGSATATADFGNSSVHVDLAPEVWVAWASLNQASGFTPVSSDPTSRLFWTPPASNPTKDDPNWAPFMAEHIYLDGTITRNVPATPGGVAPGGAATGNNSTDSNYVTGTASYDSDSSWVVNETVNPFYAAFFGANADEMTGSFALEAVTPSPVGGDLPINDDRRGFISMSGVFHVLR